MNRGRWIGAAVLGLAGLLLAACSLEPVDVAGSATADNRPIVQQQVVVVTVVVTPTPDRAAASPNAMSLSTTPIATMLPASTPTPAPQPTATALSEEDLAPLDVEDNLVANLYERVGPSVVHITSQIITSDFFYGVYSSEGTGSGFVWDDQGHIVTNYHVIEGASSVEVIFSDERQVPAEIIGVDPRNDLAVLRVDPSQADLRPLTLGESAGLRVGQRAIAIGNPFGLDRTLTTGVISALGRPLQTQDRGTIYDVVQTDAAINPGNSGGPLLDSRGRVIGINTAIQEGAEGIGFAVPVDTVKRVVPVLIRDGRFRHPTLGLLGYSIGPALAEALSLPVEQGVLVAQLYRGGPADQAGIRGAQREVIIGNRRVLIGGDIITSIDGQPVRDWSKLAEYIALRKAVGDQVTLAILRDGQSLEVPLTLAADTTN